ncbi:ABC transporter ATP-binding protein [Magnetococcus sp. PR-3]|uniref:ABC transporter ATP-binding protein n=1 Tax=Magnetococcus sp. PR-3 TaxID=3120355 RepID=UPI002FCE0F82
MLVTSPLIQLHGVDKYYGKRQVLHQINLQVGCGEVVGFLGPNGAGKSTTMSILAGVLAPCAGSVQVAGINMVQQPERAKVHLGFLPEQPPLYKEMTVSDYLHYLAQLRGVATGQRQTRVAEVLSLCGLGAVSGRLLGHLSKGYQQRAGLAQALVHQPNVVVLDEPTVGLDPIQIQEIRALIRQLGQQCAVLLSTHILSEVRMTCDRVVLIHQGQVRLNTSMKDLDQRLAGPRAFYVQFGCDPGAQKLQALQGVAQVQAQQEGWLITPDAQDDPTQAVVAAAVAQQWDLRCLQPQQLPLESLFTQLVEAEA